MLNVCENFVHANLLKFKVKKSVATLFNQRRRLINPGNLEFVIEGGVLPIMESLCHLGALQSDVRNDMISVEKRTKKFYAAERGCM